MPSTGFRRRAELSGALDWDGVLEPAFLVVAADASWSVKDGVGTVGIDMDLDPRPDEMRTHRALRDLQLQGPVGDAIVVADLPLLFDAPWPRQQMKFDWMRVAAKKAWSTPVLSKPT
jgi:hypothetical protein